MSNNFGLEVYTENGELQFELGKWCFGLTEEITFPIRYSSTGNTDIIPITIPAVSGYKLWAMVNPADNAYIEYVSENQVNLFIEYLYYGISDYRSRPVTVLCGVFV